MLSNVAKFAWFHNYLSDRLYVGLLFSGFLFKSCFSALQKCVFSCLFQWVYKVIPGCDGVLIIQQYDNQKIKRFCEY